MRLNDSYGGDAGSQDGRGYVAVGDRVMDTPREAACGKGREVRWDEG